MKQVSKASVFLFAGCIFTQQSHASHAASSSFFHGAQFSCVFAQGTEIRAETWGWSHPSSELPKHMIVKVLSALCKKKKTAFARVRHGDE